MTPHFFKTHSRLGMINIPNKGTKLNIGVEDGSDSVVTKKFLKHFSNPRVTIYSFSLPENIQKSDYQKTIALQSKEFAELINASLSPNETQVVVGGDHSVAFGSLLAVVSRVGPASIGYIQFDSHGDVHLFKTSPSGNFHGMWLRPFIGEFDSPDIASMVPIGLKPGQIMFIGNLELEDEERDIFAAKKIVDISSDDLAKDRQRSLSQVKKFVEKFDHIHISFDIDVFNRELVSATGTPAEDGLQPDEVFDVLDAIAGIRQKSIDLVEVNPHKENSQSTIEIAQKVLLRLTGSEQSN